MDEQSIKQLRLHKRSWFFITLLLLFSLVAIPAGARPDQDRYASYTGKVSNDVLKAVAQEGDSTSIIILLQDQADVSAAAGMEDEDARGWYVYNTLKEQADRTQAPIIDQLQAEGVPYQSFWAANMIIAQGDQELVAAMAARPP